MTRNATRTLRMRRTTNNKNGYGDGGRRRTNGRQLFIGAHAFGPVARVAGCTSPRFHVWCNPFYTERANATRNGSSVLELHDVIDLTLVTHAEVECCGGVVTTTETPALSSSSSRLVGIELSGTHRCGVMVFTRARALTHKERSFIEPIVVVVCGIVFETNNNVPSSRCMIIWYN